MDGGRRTSTVRQLQLLIEFAEGNIDLALGRLRSKEARALSKQLWAECADTLNAEGPARLPKEWTKIWNDTKSRVRSKLTSLNQSQRGTGGGPPSNISLTPLEDRVANIIGRDVGPLINVAQDPFLEASPAQDPNVMVEELVHYESNELNLPPLRLFQSPLQMTPTQSPGPSSPVGEEHEDGLATPRASPTPRRSPGRQRLRQRRPYQRRDRTTRVQTQAQTTRGALDESRAMILRIEELRARTDSLLAESALKQAEAAQAQANAALLTAKAFTKLSRTICTLVPAVQLYIQSNSNRISRRLSSSEEDN